MLIPLHAAPHHAVAEIDALYDVYLDVIDKWGTDVSAPPVRKAPPHPHDPTREACSWVGHRASVPAPP